MGNEFRINTYQDNWQRSSNVLALRDGGFVVTWESYFNNYDDGPVTTYVAAQFYDANGLPVGGEKIMRALDGGHSGDPQLTQLANGNIVFTWIENPDDAIFTGDSYIAGQVFSADGTAVSSAFRVDTVPSTGAVLPSVVAAGDGGFVVTYGASTGTSLFDEVYYRSYSAAGVPSGPARVMNTVSNEFDEIATETVALSNGNSIAIWNSEAAIDDGTLDGRNQIRATIFRPDGTVLRGDFGLAPHIGGAGDDENFGYDVTATGGGGFAIANLDWADTGEAGTQTIFMQFFGATGQALGGDLPVYTSDEVVGDIQIARLATGQFVVVWDQYPEDGAAGRDVMARVLSANGTPVSAAFVVGINADGYDTQEDAAVAALAGGGFVVTYNSESIDIDDEGVAGRIFGRGTAGANTLAVDATGVMSGLGGNDIITGDTRANALYGDDGNDRLTAGAGNDILDGGAGNDTMVGGTGNDLYYVDSPSDVIAETAGNGTADRVSARASYAFAADDNIELMATTSSSGTTAINLTGNALRQSITGNAGANVLHDGGAGAADTLAGLAGNDTYRIYNAGDVVVEAASHGTADRVAAAVDYRLGAGVHVEIMTTNGSTGTSGIDLTGNEFAQDITGNDGDNRLEGKGGNDTLTGLKGDDTFVFASTLGSANVDTITDFKAADDRFLLSDAVFTALNTGALLSGYFRANTTGLAQDGNDHIIYETDTGELYYDFNGTGAGGGVLFAKLIGLPAIGSGDFYVA